MTWVAPSSSERAAARLRFADDDGPAALDDGAQHAAEAYGAAAHQQDRRAGAAGERAHDRARPGLHAAAERPHQGQGHAVRHLHDVALIGQRPFGEGGLAEEAGGQRLAVAMHGGRAVGTTTSEVQGVQLHAIGRLVPQARLARAARAEGQRHPVARLDLGHRGAHRLHHARALVAEHGRQGQGQVLVAHRQVGVAEADAVDAHQDLVGARRIQFDRLQGEVLVGRMGDGGEGLHGGVPVARFRRAR